MRIIYSVALVAVVALLAGCGGGGLDHDVQGAQLEGSIKADFAIKAMTIYDIDISVTDVQCVYDGNTQEKSAKYSCYVDYTYNDTREHDQSSVRATCDGTDCLWESEG